MPRPLQRMPLELGLDLDINQLLRDGFIEPGQMTQLKDIHWLDDDGDVKANAQIAADMTKGSTVANAARYGTMRVPLRFSTNPPKRRACNAQRRNASHEICTITPAHPMRAMQRKLVHAGMVGIRR